MCYYSMVSWKGPDKSYNPRSTAGPFTRTVSAKKPMEVHHIIPLSVVNRKYTSEYSEHKNEKFNSDKNTIDLVAYKGLENKTGLPYHRRGKEILAHSTYDSYVGGRIAGKDFNGAINEAADIRATITGMNSAQCLDEIQ